VKYTVTRRWRAMIGLLVVVAVLAPCAAVLLILVRWQKPDNIRLKLHVTHWAAMEVEIEGSHRPTLNKEEEAA
jgi:hypothetical protein